jgi:hypothetical protein
MISQEQTRIARKLGERLAAGDETAIEDIDEVLEAVIREGDERFGADVIVQIMFGMMPPDVFDAMWKRHIARLRQARDPKANLRHRTELAYIKSKVARPEMQTST